LVTHDIAFESTASLYIHQSEKFYYLLITTIIPQLTGFC